MAPNNTAGPAPTVPPSAWVGNAQYDFFLSYAHAETLTEWSLQVQKMVSSALTILLKARLRPLVVFTDAELLKGNGLLTKQLKMAVESSAAVVIVLTGHYGQSAWCQQEATWFRAITNDDVERIFVVRAQYISSAEWPPVLKVGDERILGFPFCDDRDDALPYGMFLQQQQELGGAVIKLSQALYRYLRARERTAPPPQTPAPSPLPSDPAPPPPPPSPGPAPHAAGPPADAVPAAAARPRVLVGFTPEDLEPERAARAARLAQEGLLDVQAPPFPDRMDEIHEIAEAAARDGACLVQICGRSSGRWDRNADGFVAHQIRLFEAQSRPTWLTMADGVGVPDLPASAYAQFLGQRAANLKAAPSSDDIRTLLAQIAARDAWTLAVQSRRDHAAEEQMLRQALAGDPTIVVTEQPDGASPADAFLLIFTDQVKAFLQDLTEYERMGVASAPRPAAVINASSDATVNEDDVGYPVFQLHDPELRKKLGAWLRAKVKNL